MREALLLPCGDNDIVPVHRNKTVGSSYQFPDCHQHRPVVMQIYKYHLNCHLIRVKHIIFKMSNGNMINVDIVSQWAQAVASMPASTIQCDG